MKELSLTTRERQELVAALTADHVQLPAIIDSLVQLRERRLSMKAESAADHAARLAAESLRHRAVHHPYLAALGAGRLPDVRWALADFARHYIGYSLHFPRFLTTVISRLESALHRAGLLENLTEEAGNYEDAELQELAKLGVEPDWIVGIPHPRLFQRFASAMGVNTSGPPADQVTCWREMFMNVLASGTPAEAVGALGLGTENIVRSIYAPFVQALRGLDLAPRDTVFFPLHTAVDDHHQATLQAIAADFAATDEGRAGLRRGMLKALTLRTAFWDWLYERAQDPARADEAL